MVDLTKIDWSKVRKVENQPTFSPKLPYQPWKWVTKLDYSKNIPLKQTIKPTMKFGSLFKPKKDDTFVSADSFQLNKPITVGQRGIVESLVANIAKGEDIQTIRNKYPEIAEIGDGSLEALQANVKRGDSIDDIIKKYPEFQWIKEGEQGVDEYKYNIAQKPYKYIEWLRQRAEDINIPVVEPIAKGTLGVLWFGTKGMRDVIQGGAWLVDKAIGGDKVYDSGVTENLFDVWQWAINTAAAVYAPVAWVTLWAVMSALPEWVRNTVWETFGNIGSFIAKAPGLREIKERLPEDRREEFDNEVAGAVAWLLLGVKNKGELISNPKQFIKTNLSPKNILQNIEQNVLNIPSKVRNIPSSIKSGAKWLWETAISSNWKIQPAIKSKFEKTFGWSIEKFALDNDLVWKDVSDSAKIADNFKIEKMTEKIDNVRNFWWTKNDKAYKRIAKKMEDNFQETFEDFVGKKMEDFTDADWELVQSVNKTWYDIYKSLQWFIWREEVTYLQLEWLKEVFDYYNPAKLEYDYQWRPVNVWKKDTWYWARNRLQDVIEEAGEKNWVDIKGMNRDIQKAHILYKWLTRADARMSNHNILWLMDTQIATLWALVWGDVVGIGSLFVRKALQSDWFLSWMAKKLYGTKQRTPYSGVGATGVGRVGRISNVLRNTPDFRQKLKSLPESAVGSIDDTGILRYPKDLSNVKPAVVGWPLATVGGVQSPKPVFKADTITSDGTVIPNRFKIKEIQNRKIQKKAHKK